MKILALDFDGVIVDSWRENVVSSFNTYLKFFPHTEIFGGKKIELKEALKILEKYKSTTDKFYNFSIFIKSAMEQVAFFMAIDENVEIKNRNDFDDFLDSVPQSKKDNFQKEMYEERKELKKDFKEWSKLIMVPFQNVINTIKKLRQDVKIYIISNKDKETIMTLLKGIGLEISPDRILDKDTSLDKLEKLNMLIKKYNITPQDILFIDDILSHLLKVKPSGVKCYLATWGYNNEKQQKEAEKAGITLLTQDNFYEKISEAL